MIKIPVKLKSRGNISKSDKSNMQGYIPNHAKWRKDPKLFIPKSRIRQVFPLPQLFFSIVI